MRTAIVLLAYAVALAFGLYQTFAPTIDSRFTRVQTERGDGMLNHYILEHSWQSVSNPNYRGSMFSPPCFFPQKHTLWYSEHMLGVALVYWALRLAVAHDLAFQWWQIVLAGLNFVAFAYGRRMADCPHVLAILGGYLWAFGLVHIGQIKHQQMIALLDAAGGLLRVVVRCRRRPFAEPNVGLRALQCISCVHTGWFLVTGLAVFLPLAITMRPGGFAETVRFVKEHRWRVVLVVVGWIAAHVAAFVPYIVINSDVTRSYKECAGLIPTPAAWLTGPPGTPWDKTLGARATNPTGPPPGLRAWVSDECYLFCGFGVYALMLAAGAYLFVVRKPDRPPEFALIGAGLITAVVWALLTLTLKQEGHSLWELVRFLPGATAIRCVSRLRNGLPIRTLAAGMAGTHDRDRCNP